MVLFEQLKNQSKYWIRFELGLSQLEEKDYFNEVYHRAKSIFHYMFGTNDEMLLVFSTDTHIAERRELPAIKRFLRNKKLIYGLTHETIPFEYDEEDMTTTRYGLKVKKEDLFVDYIIRALGNKQSHRKPRIDANLYIVNLTRQTLFHMYDERGCDVYSLKKEELLPLYRESRKWILDYNRIEIDRNIGEGLFNCFEKPVGLAQRERRNKQQVQETKINLYEDNTCHITHELEIPKEYVEECLTDMQQTGFQIVIDSEHDYSIILKAMKTEALALIDYQTELMCLYAKKHCGQYKGWSIIKAF